MVGPREIKRRPTRRWSGRVRDKEKGETLRRKEVKERRKAYEERRKAYEKMVGPSER